MGQTIAKRYQLNEKLGEGGMGTVFLGEDTQTKQPVAIKQLKPELLNADMLERFQREGQALRDLNHPNIVKMLDAVEEDGSHYLIMEYVSGGDLKQLIEQGQLPIQQVLQIAIDLADALTRAHRLDIVHRDLKPANVLIAEDGTPRLTDFGVAHIADKEQITGTNAIVGTIDYLAPETFQGGSVDNKTDIWAFGVLLFEMLTGQRPFRGQTTTHTIYQIVSEETPDLEELRPDIPIALADLVYRMLEKDSHLRVPSVRHVGTELEDILQGRSSHTPPESRFETPIPELFVRAKHNLPHQATEFVGREAELSELGKLLDAPKLRLITILAPGGMGKTRLSLAAAEQQLEQFEDGVYFVELAPLRDPNKIVHAVAEAAGYQLQSNQLSPKQELLHFLSNKTMLLVMDNYEHLMEGASLVTEILNAAPNVQILASSRERLGQAAETIFHLSEMDFPEWETPQDALEYAAVKLFMQGAKRARPNFELTGDNLDYVARICRLVGGMPLGIVLAAAWISVLSLEEVAEELQGSFDILADDAGIVPERQQSIHVVFDYSWQMMSPDEQSIFRKMSIFRGGFSRQAAQAITGANLRTLMSLSNKALLRRDADSGRYQIHELLRQYAREKLNETGEADTIRDAHSHYYLEAVAGLESELKGAGNVKAVQDIAADLENVEAAWYWAAEQKRLDDIEGAMESLFVFHFEYGRREAASKTFSMAAQALDMDEPQGKQGLILGQALALQGAFTDSFEEAHVLAERSLAILAGLAPERDLYLAFLSLARTHYRSGNYEKVEGYYERALSIIRSINDDWWLIQCLVAYSWSLVAMYNRLEDAYPLIEEAYKLARKQGIQSSIARSGDILGLILGRMGKHDEGLRMRKESLAYHRKNHNLQGMRATLNNVGWESYSQGKHEEAYMYLSECMQLVDAHGLDLISGPAYHSMAATTHALGKLEEAKHYYYLCMKSALKLWMFREAVSLGIGIGALFVDEGQLERGLELLALTLEFQDDPSIIAQGESALERIKNELDADTYQAIWERGKTLDLKTVLQELLEEFERDQA